MGYWESLRADVQQVVETTFDHEEITMGIYRMGRIVVGKIYPEKLMEFPEYDYTEEQEKNLILLLAEIQSNPTTASEYQEI